MRKYLILILLIVLLSAFNCFFKLNTNHIAEWDEARRGVAAYEMVRSGDYVVNRYMGHPDYWSVKPPLGLWLMSASYKLLGFNRFALRFPAACAGVLTVALIVGFGWRRYGPEIGIVAGLVLVTMPAFLFDHSARAGEYDALLVLLLALAVLAESFIASTLRRAIAIALIAALIFLLKSFALVLLVPILIAGECFSVKRETLNFKDYAVGLMIFLVPVVTWALCRYSRDGALFFQAMIDRDLLGRTIEAVESHVRPIFYYFEKIVTRNPIWIGYLFILTLLVRPKLTWQTIKENPLLVAWLLGPLLIATLIQTKISWYINPMYPALAVLIGVMTVEGFRVRKKYVKPLFIIVLCASQFAAVRKIIRRDERPPDQTLLERVKLPEGSVLESDNWFQSARYITQVERGFVIRDVRAGASEVGVFQFRSVGEVLLPSVVLVDREGNFEVVAASR